MTGKSSPYNRYMLMCSIFKGNWYNLSLLSLTLTCCPLQCSKTIRTIISVSWRKTRDSFSYQYFLNQRSISQSCICYVAPKLILTCKSELYPHICLLKYLSQSIPCSQRLRGSRISQIFTIYTSKTNRYFITTLDSCYFDSISIANALYAVFPISGARFVSNCPMGAI